MSLGVVFTPEAEDQLVEPYRYIAAAGSAGVAARYVETIVAYCEELADFPHRGKARDDIRSGLRTIGFRRRVVIAFAVLDQPRAHNRRKDRRSAVPPREQPARALACRRRRRHSST